MREITDHIVPGDSLGHQITLEVLDEPGQGGACHQYSISWPGTLTDLDGNESPSRRYCSISFQNGPIREFVVNGISHEALLAIVIDRLRSFQAGPFACQANAEALAFCDAALKQLQIRTVERIKRGVEGTHAA